MHIPKYTLTLKVEAMGMSKADFLKTLIAMPQWVKEDNRAWIQEDRERVAALSRDGDIQLRAFSNSVAQQRIW